MEQTVKHLVLGHASLSVSTFSFHIDDIVLTFFILNDVFMLEMHDRASKTVLLPERKSEKKHVDIYVDKNHI